MDNYCILLSAYPALLTVNAFNAESPIVQRPETPTHHLNYN